MVGMSGIRFARIDLWHSEGRRLTTATYGWFTPSSKGAVK